MLHNPSASSACSNCDSAGACWCHQLTGYHQTKFRRTLPESVREERMPPKTESQNLSKADYEAQVGPLRVELLNAQFDLRQADFSLLILLTGVDRVAVEETYELLHEWLDARYVDSDACLDPTDEERERPFVWRYNRMLPTHGRIGVFLDAWVKDLVGRRLLGHIDEAKFAQRLGEIQVFTGSLVDDGNVLVRFFFDLSKNIFPHEPEMISEG